MRTRESASVSGREAAPNERLIVGGHKPDELTHEDRQVAAIADKSRRRVR